MSRRRKQLAIELTERRAEVLTLLAVETESVSTNGPNKGEPSIAAMLRRMAEGQVQIYYQGKRVNIPFKYFFEQA